MSRSFGQLNLQILQAHFSPPSDPEATFRPLSIRPEGLAPRSKLGVGSWTFDVRPLSFPISIPAFPKSLIHSFTHSLIHSFADYSVVSWSCSSVVPVPLVHQVTPFVAPYIVRASDRSAYVTVTCYVLVPELFGLGPRQFTGAATWQSGNWPAHTSPDYA
jgi:hypothetical protein